MTDDSPKDEEHDWDTYLIETNSEAAPACNFKQSFIPPKNEFNMGEKLESIDPRNQDSWCIGTIIDKDGPRIRIRLDGTDDRNDFWRLVDSTDIRCCGTTVKLGGQIVPPLGFQQNSTRWAKYFERNVKNGPFADALCFKTAPTKPEKNLFKRGQKLEAVDPKHPELICPATVNNITYGDHRIMLSLDGWSSSNNFKVDYASRDIFPVGWCKSAGIRIAKVGGNPPSRTSMKSLPTSPNKQNGNIRQQQSKNKKIIISPSSNDSSYSSTTMDEKNNNLISKKKSNKTSPNKNESKSSIDFHDIQTKNIKKEPLIVTVYWNYIGDNGGMLLNPQRFHSSMPSIFGPGECNSVLKTIFDTCIKCSFQPTSFINRILDLFPSTNDNKKNSSTQIKLENGTIVNIPNIENEDDFWEIIRIFQNGILAGNDLFISTLPHSIMNQSNDSSSSYLDSSLSPDKKELSPLINQNIKRKSTELNSENKTFLINGKVPRATSTEKSVYDTKPLLNSHPPNNTQLINNNVHNGSTTLSNVVPRRPERFTPSDVAAFVRGIDPSFDSLASRFLQEEIDGKALLLLTTDTLMRHMGLKLGPSLKIVHHIEKLKKG
ncbi:unnamed protein product [Rotaria sp. Silwood2]|nr:unnamed protein product [Rotaria sp. Silwood2]CAF4052994.1 unnamed protein product [Rotaria sp. Silwood2]